MIDLSRKYRVSPATIRARRKAMEDDVWLFYRWVWAPCMPKDRAIERFHRPLMYIFDGDADRLAWCLSQPERFHGKLCDDLRRSLKNEGIDWTTPEGVRKLRDRLRKINNRMSRFFGKTTQALCVLLKMASVDPDISIGIGSKSDKAAWDFCKMIGNVMREDAYALYFPDRLHRRVNGKFDYTSQITNQFIRMAGRKNPAQETIEARGLRSQWARLHFDVILGDDISGTETGDASILQALAWLGNLDAISQPPGFGRATRIILNGTKQGGNDDMAVCCNDSSFFTIRMPIWVKTVASTLKNAFVDGVAVLPEFANENQIREFRATAEANPQCGIVWFLKNFELSDDLGALQFTEELLRAQTFSWVWKLVGSKRTGKWERRRFIRRYKWVEGDDGAPGPPLMWDKSDASGKCACPREGCNDPHHAYVEHDPFRLPRVLGVDQSVSVVGDPWGVSCVAIDPEGYLYWLKGEKGHGYGLMVPKIVVVYERWGGLVNPPRKVGIEGGAAQSITVHWMQQGGVYGDLHHRVVEVPPGQLAKKIRMFNNILSPMLQGRLYVDPEDFERQNEMMRWDGTKANPSDGLLDAGGIACFIHNVPAQDRRNEQVEMALAQRQYVASTDDETGIDLITPDFLEEALEGFDDAMSYGSTFEMDYEEVMNG